MSGPVAIETVRCTDCDEVMEDVATFGTKWECPSCGVSAQAVLRWEDNDD